jgi:hypothetical protein
MRESLWRRLARLELDRHAHETAWRVPMPPGLSPAGARLWEEEAARLADAPDGPEKLLLYQTLSALDRQCVEIMVRVRGESTT